MTKLTLESLKSRVTSLISYSTVLSSTNATSSTFFPAENRRKQDTFPGSSDRVLWTPSKLCVSFLFFWFSLHFLFSKQILHLPIRRCFKEQKLNTLGIVYNHKDADVHQHWKEPLLHSMDWLSSPGLVLTVGPRTPVFKFSVSFYGEFFPSFIASAEALAALAGKVQLGAAPFSTKLLLIWCDFSHLGKVSGGWGYDVFVT